MDNNFLKYLDELIAHLLITYRQWQREICFF